MRHKMLVVAVAVCLVVSMSSFAFAASLSDVNGHWASSQIGKWVDKGLASGYPDGTFKPDKPVSRAEFVSLLNRSFDKNNSGAEADFIDVNVSDWFYAEVATAKANGYISGYEDGAFRPNNPISRQEVATIVFRLLKLSTVTDKVSFNDAGTIAPWANDAVNAAVTSKIMGGYPDGSFKAANQITRAEALVTLDRALSSSSSTVTEEAITGQVLLNGKAIEGAVVRIFAKDSFKLLEEVTSDKNGKYDIRVKADIYDITATKDNYVAYVTDVSVEKGSVKDLDMAEGTVISGKITDKKGNTLKQAKLFFTTNPTFVTTTNSSGYYTVTVLSDSVYTVRGYNNNKSTSELVVLAENIKVGKVGTQTLTTIAAPYTTSSGGGGGGGGGGSTISDTVTVDNQNSINVMDIVTLQGTVTGSVVTVEAYTGNGTTPVRTASVVGGKFNMSAFYTTSSTITLQGKNAGGTVVVTKTVNKSDLATSIPQTGTVSVNVTASTNIMDIVTLQGTATGSVVTVEAYTGNGTAPVRTANVVAGQFSMSAFYTTSTTITVYGKNASGAIIDTTVVNKSNLSTQINNPTSTITVSSSMKRMYLTRISGTVTGSATNMELLLNDGTVLSSVAVVSGGFSFTDIYVGNAESVVLKAKATDGTVLATLNVQY